MKEGFERRLWGCENEKVLLCFKLKVGKVERWLIYLVAWSVGDAVLRSVVLTIIGE